MPTYVYGCDECGHVFETMHSLEVLANGPKPECERCKSRSTSTRIQAVKRILKGDWSCAEPMGSSTKKREKR